MKLILDVSNMNPIDSVRLRSSGTVALLAKATEGTSFHDATLPGHRRLAHVERIPFGSYLYLHRNSNGSEADAYLDYAKPVPGDLQPVVDAEDDADIHALATRTLTCLRRLRAKGYNPIWYANVNDAVRMIELEPELRSYRVWQAQYPAGRLQRWLPRLAKLRIRLRHGLTVVCWQWTDRYQVDGRGYDASRLLVRLDTLRIPHGL